MKKQIRFVSIIIFSSLLWIGSLTGCASKEPLLIEGEDSGQEFTTEERKEPDVSKTDSDQEIEKTTAEEESSCIVYVCGQVVSPGVYTLSAGSRICDVFEAAGGMTPDAEVNYWNQAELLTDGAMIYVPTKEEAAVLPEEERYEVLSKGSSSGTESGMTADGRVNLNTATKEQLMTIPGIGEAKAESILAYREEQGGFCSAEDIMNISGIKEGMYAKIKDYISAGE